MAASRPSAAIPVALRAALVDVIDMLVIPPDECLSFMPCAAGLGQS